MAKAKSQRSFRSKKKAGSTSDFWALLTILAFPLAILLATALDISNLQAFFWGILASVGVLTANAMAEGHLWMFDAKWQEKFEQPDFSFRLAVTTGTVLLLLESAVLVMLFSGNVERNLMTIVYDRTCMQPDPHQIEFCSLLDQALSERSR